MKKFEPSIAALRLAVKIAQVGKLTRAASELHTSQSAASHALNSLELQLGTSLFVRVHEGLRLSEAGQRLCPFIEAALSGLDRIRVEAAGLSALETGTLRIASVSSLLGTILPPILREYSTRYPGVELSIFEGTDDEVLAWVKSGVAQLGFAALPMEGVIAEEVARDEWLALVPTRQFREKDSMTLRELSHHKFLMSGGGCERHIQRMFFSAGIVVDGAMMVKEMSTIHAMVSERLGVSLIPRLSAIPRRACRLLPLKPRLFRHIGMFHSASSTTSPPVVAWEALVRTRFKRSKITVSGNSINGRRREPGRSNRRGASSGVRAENPDSWTKDADSWNSRIREFAEGRGVER
jgi:DNA-binding transcriptional LysR family regulator